MIRWILLILKNKLAKIIYQRNWSGKSIFSCSRFNLWILEAIIEIFHVGEHLRRYRLLYFQLVNKIAMCHRWLDNLHHELSLFRLAFAHQMLSEWCLICCSPLFLCLFCFFLGLFFIPWMIWIVIDYFLSKIMRLFFVFFGDDLFLFVKFLYAVSWLLMPPPFTLATPHLFDYIAYLPFILIRTTHFRIL